MFQVLLYVDGPPAVRFNAVDAVGPIWTRGNVVKVRPHDPGAAGTRAVDLGGGVKQTLVCQLLAAQGGGDGWGQMDVALVRLVHLGLVGEQDLWLGAVKKKEVGNEKEGTVAASSAEEVVLSTNPKKPLRNVR